MARKKHVFSLVFFSSLKRVVFYAGNNGNTAYATNHRVPTADYEVVVVTARGEPPFTSVFFSLHFFVVSGRRWGYDVTFTLSVLSVSYQ